MEGKGRRGIGEGRKRRKRESKSKKETRVADRKTDRRVQ